MTEMINAPIDIYVRDGTSDLSIFNEVFANNTYSADLIDYALVNSVCDLGAHIGSFSRFVKEHNPYTRIVAVEPDRQNATCFLLNLEKFPNVMLITARVAYAWRDVCVVRTVDNSGGIAFVQADSPGLLALPDNRSSRAEGDYPIVTLEQLGLRGVDLLKIDVEGAEFDVLLNCPIETLAGLHWIVGEYHGGSGEIDDIVARLDPLFVIRRMEATPGDMGYFCFERRSDA